MNEEVLALDAEWLVTHRQILGDLLQRTHRIALILFVLTFIGYGLAVLLWFSGNSWIALLVATLSFLFFRQFRHLSLGLSRMPLRGNAAAFPLLQALDQGLEQHSVTEVMEWLEKAYAASENPQAQ